MSMMLALERDHEDRKAQGAELVALRAQVARVREAIAEFEVKHAKLYNGMPDLVVKIKGIVGGKK